MICPVPEGGVNVRPQVTEGLAGQRKNEIHRDSFKGHLC